MKTIKYRDIPVYKNARMRWLQREMPGFSNFLMETYKTSNLAEAIYCHENSIYEHPVCKICGNELPFLSFGQGYAVTCCKECACKNRLNILGEKLKKLGVKNISQLHDVKEKKKQTMLKHYGAENGANSSVITAKRKQTLLDRYGVDNPSHSKEVIRKRKQTIKTRYGANTWAEARAMREHPEIISCNKSIWVCKCPHPECTLCQEKQFTTKATIYYDRTRSCSEQCTHILPIEGGKHRNKGTTIELIVRKIINECGLKHIDNSRKIIPPYEIDIFLPDYNIGIECDGKFWHQSAKQKQSDFKKNKLCELNEITLLRFGEDDIINHPDIVKEKILMACSSRFDKFNR